MKLVEFLQGKWLGHPLHPAIVHVPIGTWFAACVLDIMRVCGIERASVPLIAQWLVGTGLVVALVAVAPGLADWSGIKREKPAWKLGLYHMLLNLAATAIWLFNFVLRWQSRGGNDSLHGWIVGSSVAGIILVAVSAYLGSLMVFDQGVSVARFSKKQWRKEAMAAGARVPEQKS